MLIRSVEAPVSPKVNAAFCKALGVKDDCYMPAFPLPNMKEVKEGNYWGYVSGQSFEASAWVGQIAIEKTEQYPRGWAILIIYFANRYSLQNGGYAVLCHRDYPKEQVQYFTWVACDHEFASENVGRCQTRYTCKKCGVSHEVDSSD